MDKFDQSIKQAKQIHEPSNNFVEVTMQHIANHQPHKHWSIKLWVPALAGTVALVVILFVALSGVSHITSSKTTDTSSTPAQSKQRAAVASGSSTPVVAAGTDSASLASYLNGIDNSQSQVNSDQNSANSALNDSSQQVTVPTD